MWYAYVMVDHSVHELNYHLGTSIALDSVGELLVPIAFYNCLDHSLLVYIVVEVLIMKDVYADKLFVGCIMLPHTCVC
jgi:hypothetical protein